jgi:hypothetical protein
MPELPENYTGAKMTEKETYVCRQCDMNCILKVSSTMERDFPSECPYGIARRGCVLETKWMLRVKKE